MTFAVQPPSITDPSSRWLSTYSDESSPSSPEGFYSIPYYAKMQTDNPATWPTYPCPSRPSSKARLAATVNPRTIIPPFQAPCTSDIDTPSSASSYSISTPLSPFMQLDIREEELRHDEFEYDDDDDDDYIDCDFLGDTEMSEGDQSQKPLNDQFAPQAIKSAVREDQLEVVEPFNDLHDGGHHPSVHVISDRKMSSSAPGYYPSTPHHSLAVDEEQLRRWLQREQPPDLAALFPGTSAIYASQHPYSHIESSPSLALSAPALLAALHQQLYTSTGAITSTNLSNASGPIPIMQPQPIRPIPPIPIDEFMSSTNDCGHSDSCAKVLSPGRLERLSPLPLLCQPVSDAVRYQLQDSSSDQPVDDPEYYDDDVVSEGVCQNPIITDATEPFGCEALHSAQVHPTSAIGTCSAEGVVCSCGCQGMLSWR